MADQSGEGTATATPVAPAAPAVEQTPQAPPETHVAPPAPQEGDAGERKPEPVVSKRDARRRSRERAGEIGKRIEGQDTGGEGGEGAVVDAMGRKHDPSDGKYLPDGEKAPSGQETGQAEGQDPSGREAGGEAGAESTSPDEGRTAGSEAGQESAKAGEVFRIELPADHPARDAGASVIETGDPKQADAIRALINGTYHRNRDVEAREARIRELEENNNQLERQTLSQRVHGEAQREWMKTPRYKAAHERYEEIKETVGQEAASDYWRSQQHDFQDFVKQRESAEWQKVEAQREQEAGARWEQEAYSATRSILPAEVTALPEYGKWFKETSTEFNAALEIGHLPHVKDIPSMNTEFMRRLKARLVTEPTVKQAMQRVADARKASAPPATPPAATPPVAAEPQMSREEIERQAVENYRRQLATGRRAAPPNPAGSLAHSSSTSRSPEGDDTGGDTAPAASPFALRRNARSNARERARSRFS